MATVGIKYFELTLNGPEGDAAGLIFQYPEEASQTFLKKQPVVFDATSGEIEVAVDTTIASGMSLEAASGTTGTLISVMLFTYDQFWSGNVSTAGAARVSALTDVGRSFDWLASAVSGQTAKTVFDDAGTSFFDSYALDPRDAVGDTNGRILCRVATGKIGPNAS